MADNRSGAIKLLKKLVFTPKSEIESFRATIEQAFYEPFLPQGVECTEEAINGIQCDVLEPQVFASDRVMIYIHGGSFIGGSRKAWRGFVASIANASSTRVILPEIRLAPQFPFPAALEDVKRLIKSLYTENPDIIIAADGSGASIALALALSLKGTARRKIKEIVLLSPWLDFSDEAPIYHDKKLKDEIITPDAMRRTGNMYTYASNMTNPLVSPQYIQPDMLEDFPPVFIQMGEKEIIINEVRRFTAILKAGHVKYTLDVWPNMMHMFQMAHEFLDESHRAIDAIGLHIKGL
ncbi:MAG: alpha/beta hydrolase [Treponemataceae bacterium]|nr:alpha/beta hydrolase [Treponemataceae bacterium]